MRDIAKAYLGLNRQKTGQVRSVNVPAPIGGLNTKDSLSLMEPTDAVEMTNVIPSQGSVVTRKGNTEYVRGLAGDVETLIEYNYSDGIRFICANSDEINDITDPESVTLLGDGYTSARWQYANFNEHLLLVNGIDAPQVYNGTTLIDATFSHADLTATNVDGINVYRNRIYLWDSSTQDVYYGGVNSIGGALEKFPLSRVTTSGGNLVAMSTWNHDGGDGVDDFAAFFMSTGDVLLYQGSNPSDVTNWSLVGQYRMGSPLHQRGIAKIGGDIAIQTNQDFVFFSEVFKQGKLILNESKLSGVAIDVANRFGNNFGWQVILYPRASTGGWLLFNVPVATNSRYEQYIINTIGGGAAKITGWNARCFVVYRDELYFGENGSVRKADDSLSDNGENIVATVRSAYNNLGTDQEKTMSSIRNTLRTDGNVAINTTIAYDYGLSNIPEGINSISEGVQWGSPWASSWSPISRVRDELIYSSGLGTTVAIELEFTLNGQQVEWYRTDYNFTINNIV